ncbi:hypothetical protein PUN28_001279 [Cardiocondyla obscurior]|uniref:Uncharacterized protein n=1 Tax=Cardiocondyla obscurior TaxID=286306 RepID=A0AAW2H459_9HYME
MVYRGSLNTVSQPFKLAIMVILVLTVLRIEAAPILGASLNKKTECNPFADVAFRIVMRTCEKSCLHDPHVKALLTTVPAGKNCR